MPVDKTDTYCVIGAGSSGLTAAKNLREYGLEAEIIEREDEVGGNWNFEKPYSRVYESTHTISSKPFTQYPDFPMPDSFPDYPHHSEILAYLKQYARHFGLYDITEFDTEVVACEPVEGGMWWDVTVRTTGSGDRENGEQENGEQETRRYAGLVIANGHNWHPKRPDYPGEFTGEIIHSAAYDRPEIFEGKRVLIVGAGNTGCDLAVEAGQHAAHAFHSTRRGYWYAQKYVLGKPSDQIFDLLLGLKLPVPVLQFMLETTATLTAGDPRNYGLRKPDHRFLETHPIVNSLLLYYIGHGEITPKPDIERFEGKQAHFEDGSVEEVDLVVNCTGYLIRFPFIDQAHLNWENGRPTLYKNIFPPDYDNLFVIGLIQPDSGQFKLVHWQAVAMAKFLQLTRRSATASGAFMDRFRRHLDEDLGAGVGYKESTRHYVEVQHMDYLRGLADLIHEMEDAGAGHAALGSRAGGVASANR